MIAGAVSVGYQLQIESDFITQDDRSGSTIEFCEERAVVVAQRGCARQQVDAKTGHVAQLGR